MGFDEHNVLPWLAEPPRMLKFKVLVREIPNKEVDELKIEDLNLPGVLTPFRPESKWGEVISVGDGKYCGKNGKAFIKPECKSGDIVAYNSGFEFIKINIGDSDDIFCIFDYGDILLIYRK